MGCGQSKSVVLAALNSQITKLEADKNSLQHEKASLETQHAQATHEFHERSEQQKHLESEEPHLTHSVKDLTEKIAALSVHSQDPKEVALRKEIEQKDHELHSVQHRITELLAAKAHLEKMVTEEKQKVEETRGSVERHQTQNENLDEKLKEIGENEVLLGEKKEKLMDLHNSSSNCHAELLKAREVDIENKKNLILDAERKELVNKKSEIHAESEVLTEKLNKTEVVCNELQKSATLLAELEVTLLENTLTGEESAWPGHLTAIFHARRQRLEVLKEASEKIVDLSKDKEELLEKKAKLEGRLAKIKAKIVAGNEEIEVYKPICEPVPEDDLNSKEIRKELKDLKEKQEKKLKKIKEAQDKINKKMQKHGHLFG